MTTPPSPASESMPPGPGVDAAGRAVMDPTTNVIALTQAAVKRLDDLREMEARHAIEVARLVAEHLAQTAGLRAEYGEKLRVAESARIDAIRAVDVGAVQRAAEVSAAQAATLAAAVAQSAEALRAQVAAAQSAAATSLAAALTPIQADIADLRKTQYEQAGGKLQVSEGRSSNSAVFAAIGLVFTLILVMVAVAGFIVANSK